MIGFSNHLYYFPHLPVANIRPIYPTFPTVTHVHEASVPPELEGPLNEMYDYFLQDTDVYGSRNLYNYPSFRAFVANYFSTHYPELEDVQLHSGFANAVMHTYHKRAGKVV